MDNTRSDHGGTLVIGLGELGSAVLRGLLSHPGRTGPKPTVLLRPPATGSEGDVARRRERDLASEGVATVHADLAAIDEQNLAAILRPFRTVISCSGFVGGPGTQLKITRAVLAAEVERYVPWQFGVDYAAVGRGSGQDVWDEQLDVRAILRSQSRTSWIIVSTGMFMSFLFEPAFGVVDLEASAVRALGSWQNALTLTTPEDIGRLTAAILAVRPEIADEVVYLAGDTITYHDLADLVERVSGRAVERTLLDRKTLWADLADRPDDPIAKYRYAFARDHGVAWPKQRSFNARHGIAVTDVSQWLDRRFAKADRPRAKPDA